jgi:hypothetical protein
MQRLEISGAVRYIYIYIYIYACVCVCVCVSLDGKGITNTGKGKAFPLQAYGAQGVLRGYGFQIP